MVSGWTQWIHKNLSGLMVGDLQLAHLLEGGPLSPDEAARTIAAMSTPVDIDLGEIYQEGVRLGPFSAPVAV